MKKEVKTKKITINDLALITKNGFDNVTDLVDKLAISTAQGFEQIDNKFKQVDNKLDQHGKIFEVMMKELKTIHEDNKYFRQSISSLNREEISQDRKIENLTVRVEKLELNAK